MKKSELKQIIREEIGGTLKKEAVKEVILSNEILDFLESQNVINGNNAQKVHKALTAFLKDKLQSITLSN